MAENNKVLKTIVEFTYVDPELINQPNYKGKDLRIEFYEGDCKVNDEVARINSMGQEHHTLKLGEDISEEEGQKYLIAARDFLIKRQNEQENDKNKKKNSIKDNITKLFKSKKNKNIPEQKIKIYQCYEERT